MLPTYNMNLNQRIDELKEAIENLTDGGFHYAAEVLQRNLNTLEADRRNMDKKNSK
ncbi:DUF3368 domain-containing protein [Paenibacillus sp. S3N08]|uniref:DUF3368 domain-containing protein n=2 Tax=Paenibacillus agricola TaxID=2716264 RepID=A0ABX0JMT1_9BACL|nr:DUF3368 domain-containing protein [Paenibacillus agricola]